MHLEVLPCTLHMPTLFATTRPADSSSLPPATNTVAAPLIEEKLVIVVENGNYGH